MAKKDVNVRAYYRATNHVARATGEITAVVELLLSSAWRRDYSGPSPGAATRAAAALAELEEELGKWGKQLVEERRPDLSPTRETTLPPPRPAPG